MGCSHVTLSHGTSVDGSSICGEVLSPHPEYQLLIAELPVHLPFYFKTFVTPVPGVL